MRKKKRLILAGLFLLYGMGYLGVRIDHTFIHRKTWRGGWNRHWIAPGDIGGGPEALVAMLRVAEENGGDLGAAEQQVLSALRTAHRKQAALGWLFLPPRMVESMFWTLVNPKAA